MIRNLMLDVCIVFGVLLVCADLDKRDVQTLTQTGD